MTQQPDSLFTAGDGGMGVRGDTAVDEQVAVPAGFAEGLSRLRPGRSVPEEQLLDHVPTSGLNLHRATVARDRYYKRSLAVADMAAAFVALVIAVYVVGGASGAIGILFGLPLVVLISKVGGLYDR